MSASAWYVVQSRPNAEDLAIRNLERQGFRPYLPRYLKLRRHARRVERVARPLFPSYLFVALDLDADRWRAVQSTVGVARLVCRGERPAPLPAGLVEGLIERADEAGLIPLPSRPAFRPGQAVRLTEGAFVDLVGLYEGMSDSERVTVLLDLLGRKVKITAAAHAVEAAD
jgi:transcriptional antiterminator RfaH